MGAKKLYLDIYKKFIENYSKAKGYDFQESRSGSAPPKRVTFKNRVKWWTLDRPRRLKIIRGERDRVQEEILNVKTNPSTHADPSQR